MADTALKREQPNERIVSCMCIYLIGLAAATSTGCGAERCGSMVVTAGGGSSRYRTQTEQCHDKAGISSAGPCWWELGCRYWLGLLPATEAKPAVEAALPQWLQDMEQGGGGGLGLSQGDGFLFHCI